MDLKKYWQEKHIKYSKLDWIDKPTIFAKFAIKYFPKNGKLLDLGCGQGQDSKFFSENGYEVIGTEYSEKAIEFARLKDRKVKYITHDLNDTFPFRDETFDIVYSHLSVQFFDNNTMLQIIEEIFRVLKKDGILALLLNSKTDPEIMESRLIQEDLYETPSGLLKRFFNEESLLNFVNDKFKTIILDSKGETYKDINKNLIRYIGKK